MLQIDQKVVEKLQSLDNMKKLQLIEICKIGGLKISGNKSDLKKRIKESYIEALKCIDDLSFNYERDYMIDEKILIDFDLNEKNDYLNDDLEESIYANYSENFKSWILTITTRFGFEYLDPSISEVLDYLKEAKEVLDNYEVSYDLDLLEINYIYRTYDYSEYL